MQCIEGDNGGLGDAELGEQGLRRRDLVGLPGDVDMGEHEGGIGGERTPRRITGPAVTNPRIRARSTVVFMIVPPALLSGGYA
jgi:hypothetical protein